jgi:flagellar hook-associated protein 3 FlgL
MASIYRTTQSSLTTGVMNNLQKSLDRLGTTQAKMSSGKEVAKPSDSPVATASAMRYRSDMKATEQHLRNAGDAIGWLGMADTTLTNSLESIRRVKELGLSGMNSTTDTQARGALAAEVDALRDSLIGLANTKYLDRPIFAGTADVPAAYTTAGDLAGDAASYSRPVERTVAPGVKIKVNVDGPALFGDSSAGLLKQLADISEHLKNDPSSLSGDLNALDASFNKITDALSDVGARYNRVQTMQSRAEDAMIVMRGGLSEVEDIDLPKTVMDLQMQQVAYQAALSVTAKVIQPSLSDFLR